ncbi:cobalt-precorrin-5B (C(1))-methyltransferase [Telmatospirillum sp. J64-1]|uniref:cobalt-precorrin-5B (C(1))-methyltransferase n=1 Tax=Telmatospirillum sp. J64-1 TaxID=2502183 RepID=UPI00115CC14C|nr:cobalt-precorrin-5B (C(1))-methyltransferase [Telmatospirillum sp. J64-1]
MTKELRKGWTTGACATAAAKAAFAALSCGRFPDPVTITLPRGLTPSFPLARQELGEGRATASVIKDAGDDPDVTHGAEIVATLRPGAAGSGVTFRAGEGVGTVTLPGLPLPPGEPAINPAPRAMIAANIDALARELGVAGDVEVTISIPGGAELAAKTMNGRLGILGGLSILGTTGVVIPYSCSAWIHSIHRGVDVARALGIEHVAGATGKTSEAGVKKLHGLPDTALMDMGDFAGALLKYLRSHPVRRLTIGGGFAKMTKLAAGEMDLHSSRSSVDMALLASMLEELGASGETVSRARQAVSAAQVLQLAGSLPLGEAVARRARETALAVLAGDIAVDVAVFDRAGRMVGHAGP